MAHRTPARWLAPLALLGAVVAVLVVASSDSGKSGSGGGTTVTSSATSTTHTTTTKAHHHGRTYIVKTGDVMSGIAAKTGVALSEIIRLNPHVDAQSLYPGQKLKLAP